MIETVVQCEWDDALAGVPSIGHTSRRGVCVMNHDEMGFAEKAALLVSNIAFMATLGFGTCLLMVHG